ncbi:MAG: hypothetical protein MI919_36285 [Holophagales bacterium]|nr:hypothetical protein [Holophagales bacterium]
MRNPGLESRQGPSPGIRFGLVRNPHRAAEIRELRRLAYSSAGKSGPDGLDGEESAAEPADPRDARAFTVIAEDGDQLVGSVRVIPPGDGPILHPTCQLLGDVGALPPRHQLAEGGWGCVHPSHRGQGLFWSLAAHMFLLGHDLGGTHMLAGSDGELWTYWRRCGFRKTGITYRGTHSGAEYSVIVVDLAEVLAGLRLVPEFARVLLPLASDPDRLRPDSALP